MGKLGQREGKIKEKESKNKKMKDDDEEFEEFLGRRVEKQLLSREYKIFKKEAKKEKNWYEKGCDFFAKIFLIKPTPAIEKDLEETIRLGELQTTPGKILSFSIILPLILFGFVLVSLFLPLPLSLKVLIFTSPFVSGYFIYYYPFNRALKRKIEAANQSVIVTLYIAIYLRYKANMEGAIRFAASSLSGPLSEDLKKILWDVEMGEYTNVFDAISDFTPKWEKESEEFVEAMRVLRSSLAEPNEERRKSMIDRAMDIVLEGVTSRMRHYSQELRLPTLILHGIGITLPLITLVMFPMIGMFMTNVIRPAFLVLGYNIFLPFLVYHLMRKFLIKRPGSITPPDISGHPDVPEKGSVLLKGHNIPIIYPAIFIFLLLSIPGLLNLGKIFSIKAGATGAIHSLSFVWAVAISTGFYFLLTSYQKISVRKKVKSVEKQFGDALFQLGNKLAGGTPLEAALLKSINAIRGAAIADLLIRILNNIRRFGMTLEEAIFDPEQGAINYYPHQLLKDVLKAIVDITEKGVQFASLSMLTISRYLKEMTKVEKSLSNILGEVLASMKFEAYVLAPIVAAAAVGMGVVISQLFTVLSTRLGNFGVPGMVAGSLPVFGMNFSKSIPPGVLQLIVGVYMIEMVILLCTFTNRIRYGYDKISRNHLIGTALIFTTFLYTVILVAVIYVFKAILPLAEIGGMV